MVIGRGDIASVLKPSDYFVYLASGLSNSQKVTYMDLVRERELIQKWAQRHVVYFSSLCVYYSNSPYAMYKKEIERFIQNTCKNWTIIRIGNITWGKNPNTLLNYLRANPDAQRLDVDRYLVDKAELLHWVSKIRYGENDIINIPGKRVNVKQLDIK